MESLDLDHSYMDHVLTVFDGNIFNLNYSTFNNLKYHLQIYLIQDLSFI